MLGIWLNWSSSGPSITPMERAGSADTVHPAPSAQCGPALSMISTPMLSRTVTVGARSAGPQAAVTEDASKRCVTTLRIMIAPRIRSGSRPPFRERMAAVAPGSIFIDGTGPDQHEVPPPAPEFTDWWRSSVEVVLTDSRGPGCRLSR